MVFGIACLIMGGVTVLKNTFESGLALAGPDSLKQMTVMMEEMNQPLSKDQKQQFDTQIAALSKPVYRVGSAVESLASVVMSIVLIVAGIGLLRDRVGALRLTRWWAYFTIPAAVATVLLSFFYLLPAIPDASSRGGALYSGLMLLTLWAFPVLLLRHLPTPPVKTYLAARSQGATTSAPPVSVAREFGGPEDTDNGARPNVRSATPSESTWRDDPWNDNTSQ